MFSNVQRPLYKKSLPEPPKKSKKSSTVLATSEKDEQYFASLFAAVESPAKSPIPSAIDVAEQVYFTPGTIHKANTSYSHVGYGGHSGNFNQELESNNSQLEQVNQNQTSKDASSQIDTGHSLQNTEALGSKPLPLPPSQTSTVEKNTVGTLPTGENSDNYTPHHVTNHPTTLEENIRLAHQWTSANSTSSSNITHTLSQREFNHSIPTEHYSHSQIPQVQESYSNESEETESLSSIENLSGHSPPTNRHSFMAPLPRKKLPASRPKSVSIPQSTTPTAPYSASWKSESALSLEKVKIASPDFSMFKPSKNPLKRISRAFNALPGSNSGGSAKAKECYNSLGKNSSERVDAYKRRLLELQSRRTDIHSWINITKHRGLRATTKPAEQKRNPLVAHTSVLANHERKPVPKTQPQPQTIVAEPEVQIPNQENYQAPVIDSSPESDDEQSLQQSVKLDYKLDIPIETSGCLFDWDHFDKELTRINRDHHGGSAEATSNTTAKESTRHTAIDENTRSRPHSYHPSIPTNDELSSLHKHSSSYPDKADLGEVKKELCTAPRKVFRRKCPSTYIKGDSDDETPLCIVASRKLDKPTTEDD
ncbi:hypothetical protein K493DRAFT_44942 [Basidiobolus meristosporus CBS 931.73]|uniref:Uncharacterized protein n=1 Tax=Basidiobolus meristosporus CBS 931.73 TaxID=1314790 RepID=A0A1Y1Y2E6_9FUNG|nr:hypothetical protein K493DRAFT_44942 [Basidiobolus meristosporus CBS 931.73]|eukprot:ORX92191.1 hypothetical protein K493DRAFT_44942 [Basidiobolus meristosporus CBS 931.73]